MKLNELLEVIDFEFDYADKIFDVTFYAFAVRKDYTKQIDVIKVTENYVVCDFTKFVNENKALIRDEIYETYNQPWASHYAQALDDPKYDEDAFADVIIGEVVRNLLETEITQRDLDKISKGE